MGNPIQYRNTDNPSQIQGWVSHNKGEFHKMASVCPGGLIITPLSLWYAPGVYPGGVNENVSPVLKNINLINVYQSIFLDTN